MVAFLKPKLTYLEKQKLAIPWHSACATPYLTLNFLVWYLRHQLPSMIFKTVYQLSQSTGISPD